MNKNVKRAAFEKPKLFPEKIEGSLQSIPRWMLYKMVAKKNKSGKVKFTKPPMNPRNGKAGSPTDPSKWSKFYKVLEVHQSGKYDSDGIGFALIDDDNRFAIDIDDCVKKNGKPNKFAMRIIKKFNSYTEISPSGKGIRIIGRAKLQEDGRKNSNKKLEIYGSGRYVTITGNVIKGYERIRKCNRAANWLFEKYFPANETDAEETEAVDSSPSDGLDEEEIVDKLLSYPSTKKLYNGDTSDFKSHSEADIALCGHLAFWTNKNPALMDKIFRKSELCRLKKWDSKRKNSTYGAITIKTAMKNQKDVYDPGDPSGDITDSKKSSKKETQATTLINLAKKNAEFFKNPYDRVFAKFKVDEHFQILYLQSKDFKAWLFKLYYEEKGMTCGAGVIKDSISTIEGLALFKAEQRNVENRIAYDAGKNVIYYDLSNPEWKSVKITRKGWKVLKNSKIMFSRFSHMKTQCSPEKGGEVSDILEFVNLKSEEDELLFLVLIVSYFFPHIPKPISLVFGEKGAAKSTFGKIINKIVDPSEIPLLPIPSNEKEMTEQLHSHYVLICDNLSGLDNKKSDLICRAVTGGGSQKRELFTDSGAVIYKFKRCIGLNGINNIAHNTDLLDRCVISEMGRIRRKKRMTETEFWAKFNERKAGILGAIFDVISEVLGMKPPKIKSGLERMADFTSLGCNIAKVLGYSNKKFLKAYRNNRKKINQTYLEENLLGKTILEWWDDKQKQTFFSGKAAMMAEEFYREINEKAEAMEVNTKDRYWPNNASWMGRKLNEILSNLEDVGIRVDIQRKTKGARYTFKKA